jgi:hypothetical protein
LQSEPEIQIDWASRKTARDFGRDGCAIRILCGPHNLSLELIFFSDIDTPVFDLTGAAMGLIFIDDSRLRREAGD